MKTGRWLVLFAAITGAGIGWWHWTADAPSPAAPSDRPTKPEVVPPAELSFPPTASPQAGRDRQPDPAAGEARRWDWHSVEFWDSVRSVCPWPPLPSSWEVIDEPCRSVMEILDDSSWWRPLDDALGTKRTVETALGNPDCAVALADDWPGELQPELREPCSAAAMMRLADYQDQCVEKLHTDWQKTYDRIRVPSETQEEYHRRVESDNKSRAGNYWDTYRCRAVPPEAFEWIEALPVPPGDPTAICRFVTCPPITQALDLYD
ncbi:MAG: hypothetical protein OXH09_04215, partial [Gammaproteobacteria bacterium]|nr:hypothetical protein [Gammaproteobacteria bacterium]